jgi:hypothetical protein
MIPGQGAHRLAYSRDFVIFDVLHALAVYVPVGFIGNMRCQGK